MAINPPYRFSPIENPVEFKSAEDTDEEGTKTYEGFTSAAVYSIYPIGGTPVLTAGVGASGDRLGFRVIGGGGGHFDIIGSFTGSPIVTNGFWEVTGPPPFLPTGGGGVSGVIGISGGGTVIVPGFYDFSGIIFTESGGPKRVFTVSGASGGAYQSIDPYITAFAWQIIFTPTITR